MSTETAAREAAPAEGNATPERSGRAAPACLASLPVQFVRVCGWCPGADETTAFLDAVGLDVTTTICEGCEDARLAEIGLTRADVKEFAARKEMRRVD